MNTTYTLMCTHTHTSCQIHPGFYSVHLPSGVQVSRNAGQRMAMLLGTSRWQDGEETWRLIERFQKIPQMADFFMDRKTSLVSSWRKHTCHLFLDDRPLVWKWNSATRPKLWIDDSHLEPVIIQWKVNSDEESCTMTSSDGDVSHCIVWFRIVLYLYDIVCLQFACILMHTAYTGFIPVQLRVDMSNLWRGQGLCHLIGLGDPRHLPWLTGVRNGWMPLQGDSYYIECLNKFHFDIHIISFGDL